MSDSSNSINTDRSHSSSLPVRRDATLETHDAAAGNAEARMRESEERFRKIFDYSNDAIFVIDPAQDEILDVNPQACKMLGFSRADLLSMPMSAIHPHEMPLLRAFASSVVDKGHGWTNELSCLTKSGKRLPSEISASVIELAGRKCMIALIRDITERKRAEQALRESEEKLSRVLESAMDAIITINRQFRIVIFNEAAEKVFRCRDCHVVGQPFDPFLSERFRNLILENMQAFETDRKTKRYMLAPEGLTARRAGGEEFPVEATISKVEVQQQQLYTIILRDVDDLKKAQAELGKLQLENIYLQEEIKSEYNFETIIGGSQAIKKIFHEVEKVAATDSTVLILGETGTGKELVARAIHNLSKRKKSALIKVNCAALPSGLIESELFGHEKGAFTGALARKIGRFELANGGTIFLDEIGDLPLELQAKLLRVLQEGEFERVGSAQTITVDARVIAATNRDLEKALQQEKFRSDLYYRLNVYPIRLPPLRDRKADIPLLVKYFAAKYGAKMGKKIETVSQKALRDLQAYAWPGNIRELENVIERAVILTPGSQLELRDWLPPQVGASGSRVLTLEELEREHITKILELTGRQVGGERGAAKLLGMKRTTLISRMKKLGINVGISS